MGYYFATGPCIGCGNLFSFNPDLVPSVRVVEGVREPICASCVSRANPERIRNGLDPITPLPGAYDPASEFPDKLLP